MQVKFFSIALNCSTLMRWKAWSRDIVANSQTTPRTKAALKGNGEKTNNNNLLLCSTRNNENTYVSHSSRNDRNVMKLMANWRERNQASY